MCYLDELNLFDRWMEAWQVAMRVCVQAHEPVEEIWACAEEIMSEAES